MGIEFLIKYINEYTLWLFKPWELENELEQLDSMLEVSLQMKESRILGNEQKYLNLLDDFWNSYSLSSREMLLEFKMLL